MNRTFFCWNEMNEYWRKIRSFVRILLLIFIHKRRKIRAFVGWRDEMNGTFFCWNGMNEYRRKIRAFLGWREEMNGTFFGMRWNNILHFIKKVYFFISINSTNSIYTSNNISYFPFFITSEVNLSFKWKFPFLKIKMFKMKS